MNNPNLANTMPGSGTANDPIVIDEKNANSQRGNGARGDAKKQEEKDKTPNVQRTANNEIRVTIGSNVVCISRQIPHGVDPKKLESDLKKAVDLLSYVQPDIAVVLANLVKGALPVLFRTLSVPVQVAAITFMVVFADPDAALDVLDTYQPSPGYRPTLFDELGQWGHYVALAHLFLQTPTCWLQLAELKNLYRYLATSIAAPQACDTDAKHAAPQAYDADAKYAADSAGRAAPSLDDAIEADRVITTAEFTSEVNGKPFAVVICRKGNKSAGTTFQASKSPFFNAIVNHKDGPVELPLEFESFEEAARFLSLLGCLVTGIAPDLKVDDPVTAKALHILIIRIFADIEKTREFTNSVAKALQIYWPRKDQAHPILWDIMAFLYHRCNVRPVPVTSTSLSNMTIAFIRSGIEPQKVLEFVQKILQDPKVSTLTARSPPPEDSEETKQDSPAPQQKKSHKRKNTEQSERPPALLLADVLKGIIKALCNEVIVRYNERGP